ncbi:MAG: hypothetical protein AB1815_00835 [Bacillota bacterium]|jgi:beta-hydroxylase
MIKRGQIWTYIYGQNYNRNVAGKWIYEGEAQTFRAIQDRLKELADAGKFPMAKFVNKDPGVDPCPYRKLSVLCVYTNQEQDQQVREAVQAEFGLWTETYKTEAQTERDWKPGGLLYEEYIHYWRKKRGFL